jgi:hypothetical protein
MPVRRAARKTVAIGSASETTTGRISRRTTGRYNPVRLFRKPRSEGMHIASARFRSLTLTGAEPAIAVVRQFVQYPGRRNDGDQQ